MKISNKTIAVARSLNKPELSKLFAVKPDFNNFDATKSKLQNMTEQERNKYLLGEWCHSNDGGVFKR